MPIEDSELCNRFNYHQPTNRQEEFYTAIRKAAFSMASLINDLCPDSREKSLAMTKLEEAVMWANASIARRTT